MLDNWTYCCSLNFEYHNSSKSRIFIKISEITHPWYLFRLLVWAYGEEFTTTTKAPGANEIFSFHLQSYRSTIHRQRGANCSCSSSPQSLPLLNLRTGTKGEKSFYHKPWKEGDSDISLGKVTGS